VSKVIVRPGISLYAFLYLSVCARCKVFEERAVLITNEKVALRKKAVLKFTLSYPLGEPTGESLLVMNVFMSLVDAHGKKQAHNKPCIYSGYCVTL